MKKFLLGIFILLLLIFVAVPLAVLNWPALIVNDANLTRAIEYLPKFGASLESESRRIEVKSVSLLTKRLNLSLQKACFKMEGIRVCFATLELDVTLTVYPFKVDSIHRFEAAGGDIEIALKPAEEKPKKKEGANPLEYLRNLSWEKIDVEIGSFVYKLEKDELKLTGVFTGEESDGLLKLGASAVGGLAAAGLKFDGSAEISGKKPLIETPWTGGARARLKQPGSEMDVQLDVESDGREPAFDLDWAWIKPKGPAAHARWKGRVFEDAIKGEVSGSFAKKKTLVQIAGKEPCSLGVYFSGRYELKCPVDFPVDPDFVRIKTGIAVPDLIKVVVSADVQNAFPPSLAHTFKGQVKAELGAIDTKSFHATASAESKFDFLVSELPKFRSLDSRGGAKLKVHSFENLAVELSPTEFAIPAPFHILQGTMDVTVENAVASPEGVQIPFKWETRLSSKSQKLDTGGVGRLALKLQPFAADLGIDSVLEDVRMNLPRVEWLELRDPPRVVPDSRLKAVEPKSKPSNFSYRVGIKTKRPLELNSNLAQAPIPVAIDLQVSKADSVAGLISVEKFPLQLLRREAELTYLKIRFGRLEAEDTIDGSVKVAYTDYTVYVKIQGPLAKPVVELESVPPLPRSKLIATLVFGRPLNELDADQKNSVANVEGALTDGVLSYYSLYYLSSTPVESVGYDPSSKRLTAKIRLQEGTSLNVGLNDDRGDVGSLGIRRRLGRGWILRTDVEDPFEKGAQSASAFLEWLFKY